MEINDDALDFCQNLLSYTYNVYFRKQKGLDLWSTHNRIGELVIHTSYAHFATFKRLLSQSFLHSIRSEVEFLRSMVGHSSKIVSSPYQSFLTSAALLVVHMFIGFDKGCYRFLQTSPLVLYVILDRLLKAKGIREFSQFYRELVVQSGPAYSRLVKVKALSDCFVEERAPESIRMLQRILAERMHLSRCREDMEHQFHRTVPRSGYLEDIEIETVVNGDFSHRGSNEETCAVCNTNCRLNFEMHLLDHQSMDG